jgi:hypothetical protein
MLPRASTIESKPQINNTEYCHYLFVINNHDQEFVKWMHKYFHHIILYFYEFM